MTNQMDLGGTGFATKTIPQGAPLPTEHSKNYHRAWDWLQSKSEHLLILFFCFLGAWASNRSAKLAAVGPSAVTKSPNFWAGAPPPPLNKHNRFQYTVPSHIKSCTAHWWGEGVPRQKARLFVTEGIW